MKKLVTVAWSITTEVDLPEDIGVDELNELVQKPGIDAGQIISQAWLDVQRSQGVITDVQNC